MDGTSCFYLRNVTSSAGADYDGRIGYYSDRSQYQAWARPHWDKGHALRIVGINDREHLWVDAWDTRRDNCPANPDNIMTWAYNALRLCVHPDGAVVLGGVGDAFPLNVISIWMAEWYEQYPDPRDPSGEKKIDFIRLYPQGAPGRYLSLDAKKGVAPIADDDAPLVLRDHPCMPPSGWPNGTEAWWMLEPAPAAAGETPQLLQPAVV